MLSKRVLVLISCLAGIAGLGVAAIGAPPALAETIAPSADPVELEKLRLAAEQGDVDAQISLGRMYYDGAGVPQNDGEAVRYYRLAADQGNAAAQYNLGLMYDEGRGVAQSDGEAVRYYRLAADQGDAWAQNGLGLMYANGRGDRDLVRSRLNSADIAEVQARAAAWKAEK